MKLEHEIPTESKLYFGESAKQKREFEQVASRKLLDRGFEEIVTPLFSYHQRESMSERKLIALRDEHNYPMHIRADSTIDVAKILLKRVGNIENKKWFYIQPVYRFPSSEYHQIGVEVLNEESLDEIVNLSTEILLSADLKPTLQLSNIQIPRLISENLNISIDLFKQIEIEKLLSLKIDWLTELVYLENIEDVERVISRVPDYIRSELQKIIDLAKQSDYKNIKVAPLFYAQMEYYDNLFFRVFNGNRLLSRGGCYRVDNRVKSVGFSIYTDEVLQDIAEN